MAKHTIAELQQYQALTLNQKIEMTKARIKAWVEHYGLDGVYVSFSGGKDSTVLLHIARQLYPDIKAMFVDVPTQYPELKEFVKKFENVDIISPKMSFMEVCEKYGFPIISKEVSECVYGARKYLTSILQAKTRLTEPNRTEPYAYFHQKITGTGKYQKKESIPNNAEILEKAHLEALRGGNTTYINMKQCTFSELLADTDMMALSKMTRGGTTESIVGSVESVNLRQVADSIARGGVQHLAPERTQNLLGWRRFGCALHEPKVGSCSRSVRGMGTEEDGDYP